MTEDNLKEEWIVLSTKNVNIESKYFYGQVIEVLSIDDGQVILLEGYLDNVAIGVSFPELKNLLNDRFYTPIRLFLNGGKAELLDEQNMIQTLENLNFDFSSEETSYFLYEDLDDEQSAFEELQVNDEVSKYYIDLWDSMTKSEIDMVTSKYNLPLSIENNTKQFLFSSMLLSLLGFSMLYLLFKEDSIDFIMLGVSIFLILGAGFSFFLYLNPNIVTLTEEGIEIKGIRSFKILWSEIETMDIFVNGMITYIPNESSSKKKIVGGYVIPIQQTPIGDTLLMLRELHYVYGALQNKK